MQQRLAWMVTIGQAPFRQTATTTNEAAAERMQAVFATQLAPLIARLTGEPRASFDESARPCSPICSVPDVHRRCGQ
jgi:hypothetical protein